MFHWGFALTLYLQTYLAFTQIANPQLESLFTEEENYFQNQSISGHDRYQRSNRKPDKKIKLRIDAKHTFPHLKLSVDSIGVDFHKKITNDTITTLGAEESVLVHVEYLRSILPIKSNYVSAPDQRPTYFTPYVNEIVTKMLKTSFFGWKKKPYNPSISIQIFDKEYHKNGISAPMILHKPNLRWIIPKITSEIRLEDVIIPLIYDLKNSTYIYRLTKDPILLKNLPDDFAHVLKGKSVLGVIPVLFPTLKMDGDEEYHGPTVIVHEPSEALYLARGGRTRQPEGMRYMKMFN